MLRGNQRGITIFMLAHLLAVGFLILGHKENGVFMSAYLHTHTYTHPPVIKLHLQLLY